MYIDDEMMIINGQNYIIIYLKQARLVVKLNERDVGREKKKRKKKERVLNTLEYYRKREAGDEEREENKILRKFKSLFSTIFNY